MGFDHLKLLSSSESIEANLLNVCEVRAYRTSSPGRSGLRIRAQWRIAVRRDTPIIASRQCRLRGKYVDSSADAVAVALVIQSYSGCNAFLRTLRDTT